MKKSILTLLTIFCVASFAIAQSIDDGIQFLYYDRYQSAIDVLEKVVASKPKDAVSIYWLGQAYLEKYKATDNKDDFMKSKDLYQKALTDGVNDPWIIVGMGHVELLETGDTNSAKQKFEQAITQSEGRRHRENADILNAIGRANADGSSKQGMPLYGIDVLKRAQAIDTKNPAIDINLGICYLKLGSDRGGEAVVAFNDAISRDPHYAKAYYRIGLVYQSQNNLQYMNEWFGKAIAADPKFAPVYLAYFDYYKERDVNAAKEFLDKYVANADQDCSTDYFVADYLYRASKYQESIDKLKEMQSGNCNDYTRINLLYAYDYNKLGDSIAAKNSLDTFFAKADTNKILPTDYVLAGAVYSKMEGMTDTAVNYYMNAMNRDTVAKNKQIYVDSISSLYKKENNQQKRLEWVKKSYNLSPTPTNRDIFDLGEAAYNADSLELADSMFTRYEREYPDQQFGYYWKVKTTQKADTTGTAAVQPINDYINFLMADTTKNATVIGYYHAILGGYYANTAKSIDSSIMEFEKAVQFDPGNDQYTQYLDILKKAQDKAAEPQKGEATKPKSGSGK